MPDTNSLVKLKDYHAPAPRYSHMPLDEWQWLPWMSKYLRMAVNSAVGIPLGKRILMAQTTWKGAAALSIDAFADVVTTHYQLGRFNVITHDGATLTSLECMPQRYLSLPRDHHYYLIQFNGADSIYQSYLNDVLTACWQQGCAAICFNYRGVATSQKNPQAFADLVIDGIAQVQRLLDEGINPKHIMLRGHSLGSGVAAYVAYYFNQHKIPVSLFLSRPFSKLSKVIIGFLRTEGLSGHEETNLGLILSHLANPIVTNGLWLARWEVDVETVYRQIPKATYVMIRSHAAMRFSTHDDHVITYYASLHRALKTDRQTYKLSLKAAMTAIKQQLSVCVSHEKTEALRERLKGLENELMQFRTSVRQQKFQLPQESGKSAHKKFSPPSRTTHNAPLTTIVNNQNETGGSYFARFFKASTGNTFQQALPQEESLYNDCCVM